MNNRLNYSSIEDAWGLSKENDEPVPIQPEEKAKKLTSSESTWKKNVKKNIMSIDSNEIKNKHFQPIKETFSSNHSFKPCNLIDDHISKCKLCREKYYEMESKKYLERKIDEEEEDDDEDIKIKKLEDRLVNRNVETFGNIKPTLIERYANKLNKINIIEEFENITPSQKNLLIIIIYGILIILISDLVIKDE